MGNNSCNRCEGVGITPRELAAGTVVMVPVGAASAIVNGGPCLIAWAVVRGRADDGEVTGPDSAFWLDVYVSPAGPPLPQAYRAVEILGVPALGLRHEGAPAPAR